MKRIASAANPLYRILRKVAHSSRERRKRGVTLLDGVHLLEAYLAAGQAPQHVLLAEGARPKREIASLIQRLPVAPIVLADALFASLTELESPTGVIAAISVPVPLPPTPPGCWLFLEDIQDPGNLGSILRSAAAAGASDIWLSQASTDVWSPRVLRAAMGAHFSLRLHERTDLTNKATRSAAQVIGLAADAAGSIFDINLTGPVAFALGNEGAGLSARLRAAATVCARIPMPGHAESLNVAAAAAVCLFERVRQLARASRHGSSDLGCRAGLDAE